MLQKWNLKKEIWTYVRKYFVTKQDRSVIRSVLPQWLMIGPLYTQTGNITQRCVRVFEITCKLNGPLKQFDVSYFIIQITPQTLRSTIHSRHYGRRLRVWRQTHHSDTIVGSSFLVSSSKSCPKSVVTLMFYEPFKELWPLTSQLRFRRRHLHIHMSHVT